MVYSLKFISYGLWLLFSHAVDYMTHLEKCFSKYRPNVMSTILITQDRQIGAQWKLHLNCNLLCFNPSGSRSVVVELKEDLEWLRRGGLQLKCKFNYVWICLYFVSSIAFIAFNLYLNSIFCKRLLQSTAWEIDSHDLYM